MKNEVLWQAARSPWAATASVDDEALRHLVRLAGAVLREGAATGRRPRHVYRRAGRPCPRCGTLIQVVHQGGDLPRLTFWCPGCQTS